MRNAADGLDVQERARQVSTAQSRAIDRDYSIIYRTALGHRGVSGASATQRACPFPWASKHASCVNMVSRNRHVASVQGTPDQRLDPALGIALKRLGAPRALVRFAGVTREAGAFDPA